MSESVTLSVSSSETVTLSVELSEETVTLEVDATARGRDGSDANVTNASVNAAIEDDAAATRASLELGDSATLDVGTTAGTVAAGDHTHDAADIVSGTIDEARFPDVITVDGVTLSDGSAVELPDGTLALDASNPPKLMIHDGATTGGVPAEGWIMRGAASFLDSDGIASNTELALAEITLPTDFMANTSGTAVMTIKGKIVVYVSTTGYVPASNPFINFYFTNSTGGAFNSGMRLSFPFGSVGTMFSFDICDVLTISKTSTTVSIGAAAVAQANNTLRTRTSTSATDSLIQISSFGLNKTGSLTAPCPLRCSLIIPQDVDSGSVRVNASCDLRLEFTQP